MMEMQLQERVLDLNLLALNRMEHHDLLNYYKDY